MSDTLTDLLPLPQRLALSYVSGRARASALVLFALDARLAHAIRQQREPALAQIRIAWWRELLAQAPNARPAGDPLIEQLELWRDEEAALAALVDGWEYLIAEERLSNRAIASFAEGRAAAFLGLRRVLMAEGSEDAVLIAARRWALADLAAGLSDRTERAQALALASEGGLHRVALPRPLRPLAVLDGLARGAIARDGGPLLRGPTRLLRAFRIGMMGR